MKLRNQTRPPQRSLFDNMAVAAPNPRWHDGALIDHLGRSLHLQLDTDRCQAMREADVLHLPLPPQATERQIQDAVESWLRHEARLLFTRIVAQETQRTGRDMPALSLSFSVRGGWVQADERGLRLNWRLIEQPLSMIELTLHRAVAMLPVSAVAPDLFSALAS